MDFLNEPIISLFGRADFIGGIDNEALDFGQLESFIQNNVNGNANMSASSVASVHNLSALSTPNATTSSILSAVTTTATTPSHLPESPPDSGSEPPYSPSDMHTIPPLGTLSSYHHTIIQKPEDISISSANIQTVNHITLLNLGQQQRDYQDSNELTMELHIDTMALNGLMPDVMFHDQQHEQQTHSHVPPHAFQEQQVLGSSSLAQQQMHMQTAGLLSPTRKRRLSLDCTIALSSSTIKKAAPHVPPISAIKPEPGTLSPNCSNINVGPPSPDNSVLFDHCAPSGIGINECDGSVSTINLHQSSALIEQANCSSKASVRSDSPTGQQSNDGNCNDNCPLQSIRFSPFYQQNWHILCDQGLQELPTPHYRVDADKGFNFSNSDDAFVCQKKNHFQITCHAQLQGATAVFVRTGTGLEKIKSFHLHFYGVKSEAPTQTIRVEQSQSDRSKKPFHPVPIDLQNRQVSKVTVGRLHFSETTNNNMRKKGRPNPEQRYFQLVVGLHAHTHSGHFPIISHSSEKIIVRASNPGQFESDVELCWQRGVTLDSIFHSGCVGINTDRPDESLVVHGNLKISGHIVQPSDSRAKKEISELDTSQQLQNVKKIRVVKYRYEPEFALHSGLGKTGHNLSATNKNGNRFPGMDGGDSSQNIADIIDTGVIAQEVREVLPDAVQEAGSVLLPNGAVIDNFLLVNKDRIYMENIGAVKELCKVTGSLETRIEQLERINSRLVNIQKFDRTKAECTHSNCKLSEYYEENLEPCSHKMIQVVIVVLIFIMAICLAAISTLYFVEHNKHHYYTPPTDLLQLIHGGQSYNRGGYSQNVYNSYTGRGVDPNIRGHQRKGALPASPYGDNNLVIPLSNGAQPQRNMSYNRLQPLQKDSEEMLLENNDGPMHQPLPVTVPEPFTNSEKEPKNHAQILSSNKKSKDQGTSAISINQHDNGNSDTNSAYTTEQKEFNQLTDVDTNLIDVGQTGTLINNKSDSNVLKHNDDTDIHTLLNLNDGTIFDSPYLREKTISDPIGTPSHCMVEQWTPASFNSSKSNETKRSNISSTGTDHSFETTIPCLSLCNVELSINQTPDIPEVPELSIPENVDMSETNYSSIQNNESVDAHSLPIGSNTNATNRASNSISEASIMSQSNSIASYSNHTDISTVLEHNDEDPDEVRDYSTTNSGAVHNNVRINSSKNEIHGTASAVGPTSIEPVHIAPNEAQEVVNDDPHAAVTTKSNAEALDNLRHLDEDRKKKIKDNKETLHQENRPESVSAVTSLPNLSPVAAVVAAETHCLIVKVILRTATFNISLGSDRVCPQSNGGGSNFNITYNVPISKYMLEHHFEILFVTRTPFTWRICSTKQRTGKDHNIQFEHHIITEDMIMKRVSATAFDINIPAAGYFERQMEFRTSLVPNDINACLASAGAIVNKVRAQLIVYKINIFRHCK